MSTSSASPDSKSKPLVASFCSSFLKAEMRHIYRQVSSLERFRTVVITQKRMNAEEYPFEPVEVIQKPRKNFIKRAWLKYVIKAPAIVYRGEQRVILDALEPHSPDLMHVYFGHTGVHLLPFLKAWDRPSIVSFHGMDIQTREDQPGYRERLSELIQFCPLVLARSQSLLDQVIALGCPPEKVRLNRTGIPLDAYPLVERKPPAEGAWHVVQACRLIPKKGLPTALKAFAKLRDEYPKSRFTIAGDGPLREEIERLAGEMGLSDCVKLTGFLSQKELFDLYASAHLFLHPSEITPDANQEGVPNSMLEAMATGLPVVATLHGGIPEAVAHGKTGLLLPERDADGLGHALLEFAKDTEKWRQFGSEASKSILENFEHRAQIAKLEACYAEVLAMGRNRIHDVSSC